MSKIGKIVGEGARCVGHSYEGVTVAGEIHSRANRIFFSSMNNWGQEAKEILIQTRLNTGLT